VSTQDATIGIGMNVSVGPSGPSGPSRVRVEPNPSFGRVAFVNEPGEAGSGIDAVEILDLQGRVVRTLVPGGAAAARVTWDGRDARGVPVAPGVYQARIRRNGGTEIAHVVLLP